MSNSSWSTRLDQRLTRLTRSNKASGVNEPLRVAILGIGNELNGDDGAGVEVVRLLKVQLKSQNVLVLDGGAAPENFTGPIRRFAPQMVILVDCADMGVEPGSISWLDMDELDGFSASTHTLPPTVLAYFLWQEIGCEVSMIGIQPASTEFGLGLSDQIQEAVLEVTNQIASIFHSRTCDSEA